MSVREAGFRYCGRAFTQHEIERIRELIRAEPSKNRSELSRAVCDELGWFRPDGRRKEMSCRVAMLRMQRDGLLTLPLPKRGNGNGRTQPRLTSASDPPRGFEISGVLSELVLRPVADATESSLWNELIERYHPLHYKPLPGAQLRYLAFARDQVVAALGFGAAAWSLAARDQFIGWTANQRARNLPLVVNNARFLIPPWVRARNLASRLLANAARRLPPDWEARYGFRPVLLETFVEKPRFRGTCYRAANWICVGETQGRGKMDRRHRRALAVKDIFLYPLTRSFRSTLCISR